jgi:CRISPR-associated protein Csx3
MTQEGQPISAVEFNVKFTCTRYTLIEFTLIGNTITPDELARLLPPLCDTRKGIVISGRGPVWLFGFLIHHYHPYPWVACYDPRLGGVVVSSHQPGQRLGDVIDINLS